VTNVPSATYRLQLHADFDLSRATEIVGYIRDLGAGAVYLSPILRAATGSQHGYDVVDHREIDPSRGGAAGLTELTDAAAAAGLTVVVDVVPNHAGVADATENPAWWDVLEHGQKSTYAHWFDIDWGRAPLLIPQLGDDADLDTELTLVPSARTESGFELRYYDHAYPVAPGTGPAEGDTAWDVLARQFYRLAGYRTADTELNYRRFFAVTDLAGLRIEDPEVFAATHERMLERVRDGSIQGLRIDHPDGLVDPGGYLDRLRAAAPDAWITIEKILEPGEVLPAQWPVDGTTGYDALTEIANVVTDPGASDAFTSVYRDVTGDQRDFADHVADGKRGIATTILQSELLRLGRLVPDVDGAVPALTELAVAFPVYRSYLPLGREYLDEAIETAVARRPDIRAAVDALLPRLTDPADELCARFQQVTGAIMAKGVEDTAYYRYNRAIWLNEVGGDPAQFGADLPTFHLAQRRRQRTSQHSMTTLSTHDTKRGEDVRARLAALAERPDQWRAAATRLAEIAPVPNPAFGLLLWQTFVGAGFIERERMHAYAEKAMREANDGTSWREPDADFEAAVHAQVDAAYDDADVHAVLVELIDAVTPPGYVNALTQKVIALTMPGVPDVYQGTELWDDSLVDPDNRRPVDFAARVARLATVQAPKAGGSPVDAVPVDDSGAAKLLVVTRTLHARRERPELFASYRPVTVVGAAVEHLIAYDRGGAITLATRLPIGLARADGWGTTSVELGDGTYTDAFTGATFTGTTPVADVLAHYPVALLLISS
jgi:(1->4)-alpha-D-glucan 1-alpha-D-glucosylmutase